MHSAALLVMFHYSNSCWQSKAHHSLTALTYASVPTHTNTHLDALLQCKVTMAAVLECLNLLFDAATLKSKRALAVDKWDQTWRVFGGEPAVLDDWLPLYLSCTKSIQVSGKTAAAFHYYSPVISHQPYRSAPFSTGSWYMCWLFFSLHLQL